MEDEVCRECNSTEIVTDFSAGDRICTNCGIVIGERIIDERDEIRTFANEESTVTSRMGDVSNTYGHPLSTFIFETKKKKNDHSLIKTMAVMEKSYTKPLLAQGMQKIEALASRLVLERNIIIQAQSLYEKAIEEKQWMHVKSMEVVVVAVLYLACRTSGHVRTIKEFEVISGIEKKKIGKVFKLLATQLNVSLTTVSVSDYVERYCNALQLCMKTKKIANLVAAKASVLEITTATSPATSAAAIVYLVAALTNAKRPLEEVARVATCKEKPVKVFSKVLNAHRFQLFEGIAL